MSEHGLFSDCLANLLFQRGSILTSISGLRSQRFALAATVLFGVALSLSVPSCDNSRPNGKVESKVSAATSSATETVQKNEATHESVSDSSYVSTPPISPVSIGKPAYTGSDSCLKCHADEHKTWHTSFHRSMTQLPTPDTVKAPFNQTLKSRGRSYKFERKGDEFWVTMLEPQLDAQANMQRMSEESLSKLPVKPLRVALLTGSHNAQTFWVNTKAGLYQVPWVYHILDGEWIPNEDSFLLPPSEQRIFNAWNDNCAKCHAVGTEPGTRRGGFDTRIAEFGISCESCHGAGEQHVKLREELAKTGANVSTDTKDPIVNPAKLDHKLSSEVCGQCHSSYREDNPQEWAVTGSKFQPGESLGKLVSFHLPDSAATKIEYEHGYWNDGTCRTGGDELMGMSMSACFTKGELSCVSCHSLHGYESTTDQLKPRFETNDACLQCHQDYAKDISAHTHHAAGSSGSLCYNCHMPHISYGLFKGIRSHRIDSPNAKVTAETGRPNACNLCHLDKTLAWTGEKLTEWYQQSTYEWTPEQREYAAVVADAVKGDASQRVLAAWHLGWKEGMAASGTSWQPLILAEGLTDPYAVVRYVSYQSLKKYPGFEKFTFDVTWGNSKREDAARQAASVWKNQIKELDAVPQTLRGENGELERSRYDSLKSRRDNKPMVIPE